MATVTTPSRKQYGHPRDRLGSLFPVGKGISLIREDGAWSEVEFVDADRIAAADIYLQGGLLHEVSDEYGAELAALGYTVTGIIPS